MTTITGKNREEIKDALDSVWTDMQMILDGTIDQLDKHDVVATQGQLDRAAKLLGIELEDTRPAADIPKDE